MFDDDRLFGISHICDPHNCPGNWFIGFFVEHNAFDATVHLKQIHKDTVLSKAQ